MRKVAPWPVDWLDPAEAVAHRAKDQLALAAQNPLRHKHQDIAVITSGRQVESRERLLNSFGLLGRDVQLAGKLDKILPSHAIQSITEVAR
jgi:glutamate racemase